MPKRVIDGEAVWGSDTLATVAPSAQREYPWLYPLADCNGSFEVTNLRAIWGKVYVNRSDVTVQDLDAILRDYNNRGLLFIWEQDGKRYAHWTNSHKPGRLPPKSRRATRHENLLAPTVPVVELGKYLSHYLGRFPSSLPGERDSNNTEVATKADRVFSQSPARGGVGGLPMLSR